MTASPITMLFGREGAGYSGVAATSLTGIAAALAVSDGGLSRSSRCGLGAQPDHSLQVVEEIDEADFGPPSGDADGADKHP
jgi:hypothetical protein